MKKITNGYALALALMVIAVGSISLVSVVQQAQALFSLSSTMYDQYQARMLALSGVELVRAQLENPTKIEGSEAKVSPETAPFLYTNRWQVFDFTQEKDGFEAQLKIYLCAEQGKLNINSVFDFDKKTYKKTDTVDGLALLKACDDVMKKTYGVENWSSKVLELVQKRDCPFEDVTDVVVPALFKKQNAPFFIDQSDDDRIFLMDLFTVVDDAGQIQPLYLSQSLKKVFGFDKHESASVKDRQEVVLKISQLKTAVEWAKDWKQLLAPFYKKEYTVIPDVFKKIVAQKVEAAYFSVLCHATVHGITQRVCVLLQKDAKSASSPTVSAPPAGAPSPQQQTRYLIQRVYWL